MLIPPFKFGLYNPYLIPQSLQKVSHFSFGLNMSFWHMPHVTLLRWNYLSLAPDSVQ